MHAQANRIKPLRSVKTQKMVSRMKINLRISSPDLGSSEGTYLSVACKCSLTLVNGVETQRLIQIEDNH